MENGQDELFFVIRLTCLDLFFGGGRSSLFDFLASFDADQINHVYALAIK